MFNHRIGLAEIKQQEAKKAEDINGIRCSGLAVFWWQFKEEIEDKERSGDQK